MDQGENYDTFTKQKPPDCTEHRLYLNVCGTYLRMLVDSRSKPVLVGGELYFADLRGDTRRAAPQPA